jgi:hypothetical protein
LKWPSPARPIPETSRSQVRVTPSASGRHSSTGPTASSS